MKNNFTKAHLLLWMMFFFSGSMMAQFTVSGEIKDITDDPLIGVSVVVKGSAIGTTSDIDGRFRLEVPSDPVILVFSYTGFASEELEVSSSNSTALSIVLEEGITQLDAIVVTGLATSIKRSNAANAVASVSAKELTGIAPATTAEGNFYGKIKGVNINSNSGAPGGGVSFRIRGLTSISGSSQPLIIIDGVYLDNSSVAAGLNIVSQAAGGGSQSNQDNPSNRFSDIDPMDIETVEVLKGPSAAAIYGSRASGGVVIITTKRGKAGKTKVNFSQSIGWTEILNPLGQRTWNEEKVLNSSFDGSIDIFRAAQSSGNIQNYEDLLYGNKGILSNTRLSVSGGTERTSFFIGGTYNNDEGIVENTGYKKASARANIDHKLTDWLDISASTNYINTSADRGFFNNDNSGTTMGVSFSSTPNFAQLLPDANGLYPANPFAPSNFLETAANVTNNESVNRFLGGGTVTAKLLTNARNSLKLIFRGGIDHYTLSTKAVFPNSLQFQRDGSGLNGVSVQGNTVSTNTNLAAFLVHTYFADNGISFRSQLGITQEDFNRNTILGEASNLIGSQTNVDQSGTRNLSQFRLVQQDKGAFFQEEVNWKDRIIATIGVRADKSSNNSDANKLYYYPKASAAFNLHEFNLFTTETISLLKLRVAYGQSGNFPAFGSKFTSFSSSIVGGVPGLGIGSTLGNPEIGPERQEEIEFGFDVGLLKNRFLLDFTYYNRTVDDLLLFAQVPTSTGYTTRVTNAAALENKGMEIGLNADVLQMDKIQWATRISWWTNSATVTELTVPSFTTGGFADFLGNFRIQKGRSPTEIIGVGPEELQGDDGLVVFGDAEPDFQMSFFNTLKIYDFDFTFLFHWKKGGNNINLSTLLFDLNETTHDFDDIDLDPEGKLGNGDYRLSQLGANTEPYIEDASYLRLREIALFYNIPKSVFSNVADVRIGFSANNLINIFDYNSYDPEVSNFGGNGFSSGVEVLPFPSAKRFNFHLGVRF